MIKVVATCMAKELRRGHVIVERTERGVPIKYQIQDVGPCRSIGNVHVTTTGGKVMCYWGESTVQYRG